MSDYLSVSEQQVSVKKQRNEVLLLSLCNNLTRFLSQQTSAEMATYISEHIRKNILLFRVSLVVARHSAKSTEARVGMSAKLGG